VNINWWSAKHHVLVMHYCFEALNGKPGPAEASTSGSYKNRDGKQDPLKLQETYKQKLNFQARRLDAFMTLTMAQLERIRVRYRPSGFFCHVPVARDAIGIFSNQCTPIRTAMNERG
jgi:hypothetical protein